MAENVDKERRRLMEELINTIIGVYTVCRPAIVSYYRIQQEIRNNLYRKCLWWPFDDFVVGSYFEYLYVDGCNDHYQADHDTMRFIRTFPVVLWRYEAKSDRPKHKGGYVMAEHNPKELVYVRLRVIDKESLHQNTRCSIDNDEFLKTNDFIEANIKEANKYPKEPEIKPGKFKKHGPSITFEVSSGVRGQYFLSEVVFCLKCQSWPSITDDYFTRKRLSNWPSQELLDTVSRLDCFVVPVGHPSSAWKNIEWRLSFSVAERELIHKMCKPYVKCMYALKALKSKYFVYSDSDKPTPFCSYFIKTACLWMCETFSYKDYSLMDLIRKAVDWLIDCYQHRNLPHYFIPRQNTIGHLSRELCDGVIAKLTAVKRDLLNMVMSSLINVRRFADIINSVCDNLMITLRVNEADDYTTFETNLLKHPRGTEILLRVIPRLLGLPVLGGCRPTTYEMLSDFENGLPIAFTFPSLLGPLQYLIYDSRHHLEILRFPEEIMMPIIDNIENIVLGGYGEMFKQRLYRFMGDVYTYLLMYFRRCCNEPLHGIDQYRNKPLYYYELEAEIAYPDKWNARIGGLAVVVIYHYLMGNYKELKDRLAVCEPIFLTINEDTRLMNRQLSIEIYTNYHMMIDAWAADRMLQHLPKVDDYRIVLHPIALVFYIKARVSLIEGNIDNARAMVKEIETCLGTIVFREDVKQTMKSLITIIESQIGLLEVMRMLYFRECKPPKLVILIPLQRFQPEPGTEN